MSGDYLDLLEKVLLYSFWQEPMIHEDGSVRHDGPTVTDHQRLMGRADWPAYAFTMIGQKRLRNIRDLCQKAVEENVPGGFAECGVWRGGACIYARACLPDDRTIWACDTFTGMPVNPAEPWWEKLLCLKVTQENVKAAFEMFGLLRNVRFIEGLFKDSLVVVDRPLAILRVDCDSYSSTIDALTGLWPKLSSGGYAIFDEYNIVPESKNAVIDYFYGDPPKVIAIDDSGVWCRKP